MHEVLVNRLGGLSLPRKSVVRLTDRPDMTLDVYRGRKTTMQCNCNAIVRINFCRIDVYDCILKRDLILDEKKRVPLGGKETFVSLVNQWCTLMEQLCLAMFGFAFFLVGWLVVLGLTAL